MLGGFPNQNVTYCDEGFGHIRYKSDRFGFRNSDESWDDIDELEVVLIGDSFGAGACVDDEATMRSQFSNKIGPTISLSMGGNGPAHYYAYTQTFLQKLQPSYAVILFFDNDAYDNPYSFYFDSDRLVPSNYFKKLGMQPSENLSRLYAELDPYEFSKITSGEAYVELSFVHLLGSFYHIKLKNTYF